MSATPIATSTATPPHFADAMFDQGDAPQLRTILLTDICDSTGLVEVLGDKGTAQLFREHDRLVLTLQQQWRGRLIDRSDGLLLLFERPIDGLGFAIDYARGLAEIGKLRSIDIKIRAGLHVGEVLTWRNSEESVRVGAKPIEVEGLAKPTAARLMSMARPGQILLSAVAEPLAHRAARELGERGQHLIWKSLGRWRFKGVPEPQEIFEVGEPGIAPLRAPANSPKAWRAVPLWRRPAMLAAQLALVVAVGIGGWFVTRPAPAIAFGERDWVVVGDLRNLTGQTVLDESLEQAFRISLEQSRHVNVLSDLKTRDTLARMQLPADTVIDRDIASEIALRDGARAVILPTVAEVGGRVRISVEVIDPTSKITVHAESADGDGINSTLSSIDNLTASLRGVLGEAISSVEKSSVPLPQVSTASLDALRAYALGQKEYSQGNFEVALKWYRRAVEFDPEFALAWVGQMRAHYASADLPSALVPLRRAQQLEERLSSREKLYLAAWSAEFDEPEKAIEKWVELANLYPDFWPGLVNAGTWLYADNRFKEAETYIRQSMQSQSELSTLGFDDLGRTMLGLERYKEAASAFDQAIQRGVTSSLRRRADVAAAQRKYGQASKSLAAANSDDPYPYFERIAVSLDRADWDEAREASEASKRLTDGNTFTGIAFVAPRAVTDWLLSDGKEAHKDLETAIELALEGSKNEGHAGSAKEHAGLALSAALISQRSGNRSLALRAVAGLEERVALLKVRKLAELATVIRANELRLSGKADEALKLLEPMITGHELYQTRVALMEAHAAAGDVEAALEQSEWLAVRRGLAYIELGFGQSLQALNVADSNLTLLRRAEVLEAAGRLKEAKSALQRFDQLWPVEALPGHLRVRRSKLEVASSLGVV